MTEFLREMAYPTACCLAGWLVMMGILMAVKASVELSGTQAEILSGTFGLIGAGGGLWLGYWMADRRSS